MTLRVRVASAAAFAVLVAVVLTSVSVFLVVRRDLRGQVDESLRRSAEPSGRAVADRLDVASPGAGPFAGDRYMQVVTPDGTGPTAGDGALPVTSEMRAVARGERGPLLFDTAVDGTTVRAYVVPVGDGRALAVGRSLAEVEETLRGLALALVAISGLGLAVAAGVGHLVAAAAVAPVHDLSDAAEAIARTGDPSGRIGKSGNDELGRLADSFNAMLASLEASLDRERRLVADASHELRTPLASVRTNVELLRRADGIDAEEQRQMLADVVDQVGELSALVDDLMELARGDGREDPFETFDLATVVVEAVERARAHHPAIRFDVDAHPSPVHGVPGRVRRAVANLLDNAAKWSPPGGAVEVVVGRGEVSVRDHGPGIAAEDVDRIFDRFYRAADARGMPGAGLGLAIVRQVAETHAGEVAIANEADGGARFALRLASR